MSVKQLTDEEIKKVLTGPAKKQKGEQEFSEVTLCAPGILIICLN